MMNLVFVSGLALQALLTATVYAGCGPSCPAGYRKWDKDCYKMYDDLKAWADAEQHCVDHGAHLASVHSAAESSFLYQLSQEGTSGDSIHDTWIGFHDGPSHDQPAAEGAFAWTDGSPVDYINWHPNEPNNAGVGEHCTEINYYPDGTWNDHFCDEEHRSICKMAPSF